MASRWYYRIFNEDFGPVSFETIGDLAAGGELSRDDQLRCGDDGDWMPAADVVGLFPDKPAEATPGDPGVISDFSELNFEFAGSNEGVPADVADSAPQTEAPDFELKPAKASSTSASRSEQSSQLAEDVLARRGFRGHRRDDTAPPDQQPAAPKLPAEKRRRKKKPAGRVDDDDIADWLSDDDLPTPDTDRTDNRPTRPQVRSVDQEHPQAAAPLAAERPREPASPVANDRPRPATPAPKPAKQRRSRSGPSISLPKIQFGGAGKWIGIAAAVIVIGGLATWFFSGPSEHPAKRHFEAISKIHADFKIMRSRGASDAEFTAFAQEALQQNEQIATAMQAAKSTTGDGAHGWTLLIEASKALPAVLEDAREEESESETKFFETLKEAAREFDYFR